MKIIIAGCGEQAELFARELCVSHGVVVIVDDSEHSHRFEELDLQILFGSTTDLAVLKTAGAEDAAYFIACCESDETNIISCLAAKQLGNLVTFCLVTKKHYFETFRGELGKKLVIDHLIWPEGALAETIARTIRVPGANVHEEIKREDLSLLEFPLKKGCPVIDKAVRDIPVPSQVLIVAVQRGREVLVPSGNSVLMEGDKIVFMGNNKNIRKVIPIMGFHWDSRQLAVLVGGGVVSEFVARHLQDIGSVEVEIIEQSLPRCRQLAKQFGSRLLVLHGDGTDPDYLRTHQVPQADYLAALTGNTERNLLIALQAKELAVKTLVAGVKEPQQIPFFERQGIDVALSAEAIAFWSVIKRIRSSETSILQVLIGGRANLLELVVPEDYGERPITDLKMPSGTLIVAIRRQVYTIVPKGLDVIKSNDHLRIFCTTGHENGVKSIFQGATPVRRSRR